MGTTRWLRLAVPLLCALLSLSCVVPCCTGLRRAPTPIPTVAVSEDAAKSFEGKAEALAGEQFRLELTEQEVTSYLALRAVDALPLTSPVVHFLPGKAILEGDLTRPIRGHLILGGTVKLADGHPEVEITEARIAGVGVPGALLASLSDSIGQLVSESGSSVLIDQIEIGSGLITIVGHRQN